MINVAVKILFLMKKNIVLFLVIRMKKNIYLLINMNLFLHYFLYFPSSSTNFIRLCIGKIIYEYKSGKTLFTKPK